MYQRLGGESNWEIVLFRYTRSCVRARGLVVTWKSHEIVGLHPSLSHFRGDPFSLSLVRPSESK